MLFLSAGNWLQPHHLVRYECVGEECTASLSFLKRTVDNIPTGGVGQQFLDCVDTDAVIMDHLSQTFDPLDISHRVVSPLSSPGRSYQATFFVIPERTLMHLQNFCCHADSEDWFILRDHIISSLTTFWINVHAFLLLIMMGKSLAKEILPYQETDAKQTNTAENNGEFRSSRRVTQFCRHSLISRVLGDELPCNDQVQS